jgi:hypothetical protein
MNDMAYTSTKKIFLAECDTDFFYSQENIK